MNLQGKKITVHDMTLRDGMHPKRHLMTRHRPRRRWRQPPPGHPWPLPAPRPGGNFPWFGGPWSGRL